MFENIVMKGGYIDNMVFRQGTIDDIVDIYDIIRGAKKFLKSKGIDQWQNNYPNESTVMTDVSEGVNYVCYDKDKLVGTIVVIFGGEPTYDKIYDGEWLTEGDYATIHRMALDEKVRGLGIAAKLISFGETLCIQKNIRSIRVDTHRDNAPMQKMLSKNGFTYCGIIYLTSGDERLAFEKVLR